ncbi:LysM peptidoglycan-binding domain-containing protein [Pseudobacteroides cellulosolvens]|uniref:Peptidoglycan-binding lysin domain-containing protein n=1 Tax=Pseudobacteroides cellulosolvens ATCC 35603 = DSM 2933 TaxID=398512 RepID=A0A0L6JS35_9FIRM|nr:LysM peptidoglycan-binding domain-containing protein [Pseudobacteroides cellulosolvens]KNY28661.1 Peptidoglycan-binding lysin domain-containing protein [Pseudobacteroides cellulosolvens ATCC 35603 = DSM 2933]
MKGKLLLAVFLVIFVANSLITVLKADGTISDVVINNGTISWNSPPMYVNGQTYIPLKESASHLQLAASFDVKTMNATILYGENELKLRLDNDIACLNGKFVQLSSPMKIINNTIMIPIDSYKHLGMTLVTKNNTLLLFSPTDGKIIYKVVSGDSLWRISVLFGVTVDYIKQLNNLKDNTIYIGQPLAVKLTDSTFRTDFDAISSNASLFTLPSFQSPVKGYITSGTAIKVIGKSESWYKVITPKGEGYQYKSSVSINQSILDTAPNSTYFDKIIPVDTSMNTIEYTTYIVVSGDNLWSISERVGLPVNELAQANGLSTSSVLYIGQVLKVPVHKIAIKNVKGSQYGEMLDWYKEGQYVIPINAIGKLTDIGTGISFFIKRTMGASHSDTETVTYSDTTIMKNVFGGSWSWNSRPMVLEINGRKIAVSVNGMPHAGVDGVPMNQIVSNRSGNYGTGPNYDRIAGNGMDGHFDMYVLNGRRHMDNKIDADNQRMVSLAGGLQ